MANPEFQSDDSATASISSKEKNAVASNARALQGEEPLITRERANRNLSVPGGFHLFASAHRWRQRTEYATANGV
jgi:hypothetical protein